MVPRTTSSKCLCGILGLGLATGCTSDTTRGSNQVQSGDLTQTRGSAKQLLAAALAREEAAHYDEAALLQQAAFNQLQTHSNQTKECWAELSSYVASTRSTAQWKHATLKAFQRALAGMLATAQDEKEFGLIWSTYGEVSTAIDQQLMGRLKTVAGEVNRMGTSMDTCRSLPDAVRILSENDATKDRVDELLGSGGILDRPEATNADVQRLRKEIGRLLSIILDRSEQGVSRIDEQMKTRSANDKKNVDVGPAAANSSGAWQDTIVAIGQMQVQLGDTDIEHWTSLAGPDGQRERLGAIREKVAEKLSDARRLQLVRYNLWAIQQIYVAEDAESWPERLGQLELPLLHPSVSALYSMAYDSRIKQVEPAGRPLAVKRLVHARKVAETQF